MCPTEVDVATAACTLNHAWGADDGRQCIDPGREGEEEKGPVGCTQGGGVRRGENAEVPV